MVDAFNNAGILLAQAGSGQQVNKDLVLRITHIRPPFIQHGARIGIDNIGRRIETNLERTWHWTFYLSTGLCNNLYFCSSFLQGTRPLPPGHVSATHSSHQTLSLLFAHSPSLCPAAKKTKKTSSI